MKPQTQTNVATLGIGAKVFGLVVAMCASVAVLAATTKFVMVLFS